MATGLAAAAGGQTAPGIGEVEVASVPRPDATTSRGFVSVKATHLADVGHRSSEVWALQRWQVLRAKASRTHHPLASLSHLAMKAVRRHA